MGGLQPLAFWVRDIICKKIDYEVCRGSKSQARSTKEASTKVTTKVTATKTKAVCK